jgi:hypothetical protein
MVIIFSLTALGGVGLLTLAGWPGVLEVAVGSFPFGCVSLPLLGCWFCLLVWLGAGDLFRKSDPATSSRRWGLWSAAVMFGTMALLGFRVPQRLVFALSCSGFEEPVNADPAEAFHLQSGRRVGPYWVDRYAADERGGVYFRTHTGPDGIGPDLMSYGFAFCPNQQGSPFGNTRYRYWHLFGDWYAFEASDD